MRTRASGCAGSRTPSGSPAAAEVTLPASEHSESARPASAEGVTTSRGEQALAGRLPDFFVIGHPKCGTTALYAMLKRHPQIYMSDVKEPQFFAGDLRLPSGD